MYLNNRVPVIMMSFDEIIELGREDLLNADEDPYQRPTEDSVDSNLAEEAVQQFIGSLSHRERTLVLLRFSEQQSFPVIGRRLGMSHVGAQKMLRRICERGKKSLMPFKPNA